MEREMRLYDSIPWWQRGLIICGYEGEGDGNGGGEGSGSGGGSGEGEGQGDGSEGGEGEGSGESDGDGDGTSDTDKDTAGLKSALQKERKAAKEAVKESRRLQKIVDDAANKDKTEVERATAASEKADQKVTKLAERLKNQAVEVAIREAARGLKFRNTDDALTPAIIAQVGVEQDEDDPSDVTVDAASVKTAVKKLADSKKYLVSADGEEDPTGSAFGGGKKPKAKTTEEALKTKYPSLQ